MTTLGVARYPLSVNRAGTLVEPLAWDSEFFGFGIGRVELDDATPESLAKIDAEAREMGIACLYGSLDPSRGTTPYLVQTFGHRLVEVSLLFDRPAIPFEVRPTASVARRGTLDDLPLLDEAIGTLAPWSRFGADPRFGPEAARRMHRAWVERAASDGDERMLAVTEDESGVTGMSTQVRSPVPRVDTMGVMKQGSGASWALMAELVDWAGGGPIEAGPCAARNIAPLRFLEHCGFAMSRVRYLYHRWLDEDAGSTP
ncbi:MAG: dTDP-4-amino-4,6-dideoxy-D-galactose acyltransferase [Actinomycetota bacterium]|nr:dTDP-4-amino-4,6-dideoxy-D-galactose acyltransferase [Actinomycetota bacterium]